MFSASIAETLLERARLPVIVVRPNGDIFYSNPQADDLFGRKENHSLLSYLSSPSQWNDVLDMIAANEPICDHQILLRNEQSEVEFAYLTAIPQYNPTGGLDSLICAWSSRRNAFDSLACDQSEETVTEYTRDLEALLEHRTYQQLLTTEQNEFARQILDILPLGVMVTDSLGNIIYRNWALQELYGVQPLDLTETDARQFLDTTAIQRFDEVCRTGRRDHFESMDPGGRPAEIDLLPVISAGKIERVVGLFSRPGCYATADAESQGGLS